MKNYLLFIFSLFFSLFILQSSQAQIQTTFSYADGYNACGESDLKISLKNISPSDSITPVIAQFHLNSAMQATVVTTSEPNNEIIMSVIGNNIQIVFMSALHASETYDINVKMIANKPCDQIACGKFFATTDTLKLTYNSRPYNFYNNNILSSPCLTYDETLFSKRITTAFLGDTVTRRIVLKNTGGGKFNGQLQIKDVFGEFVKVYSIYSNTPGHTVTSSGLTNDSTYSYTSNFVNIRNGDSIVIIEKVIVLKCIKENEGKSSIYINWSCGPSLCNEINPSPIIAQIIKDKKKPDIVITKSLIPESNCLNSKTKYIYKIKNQGTRPATDVDFKLRAADYNTYTYIDQNSLIIRDTVGLNLVLKRSTKSTLQPNNREIHHFHHSCIIPNPLYQWNFEFESIMPGDSFYVEAEGFHCCPAEDTSNVDLVFETWNLMIDYKDECKEESYSTNSGTELNNILGMVQFYEPIVTDMHENTTHTFEIFNTSFNTNFYRTNINNAAFKVRLKLDTGLVYTPETLKFTSLYGYSLLPTSQQILTGAGTDGYIDTYLEAQFILPDTFSLNPTFFERFIRNSSVVFELKAICPAREPNSRFTQELLFIPDLNCSQTCEILLASFTTPISIHCPGCVTPGWVATSHSAIRLNVGEQDNDNNRLPDHLTYTPADPSKIKYNRCIPGDTLETELRAYFQDGDPTDGRTTSQLENHPSAPFRFKYSYLSTQISMGKLFELLSIKAFVMDANGGGTQSADLPLSCATKIPNIKDSLSDAEFFFDLSLDSLHKYGIDPSYTYEPGDGLRVVCQYTILEPSTFYLTNPPTTLDPWLERENASILLNTFQSLVYLTGKRNTAFDRSIEDAPNVFDINNPNLLDSTMMYWCEGYGSASTIVGKRKEISFNIPKEILCQSNASVKISLNPSGGIFRNAFPFEYRNFITLDSLHATVPPGYTLSDWTIQTTVQQPDGYLEYSPCIRTDTIKNIQTNGSLHTLIIDPHYIRQTEYGTDPCLDKLTYGDENIETTISYTITPECDLPETTVPYTPPALYYRIGPNKIQYKGEPKEEKCITSPTSMCWSLPIQTEFKKVNSALKISPLTNETQLSQQSYSTQISLEETNGYDSKYSFLKVKSLNNKVKPEKLVGDNGIYYADSNGIFQLDTLISKTINHYQLYLSNICGKLIEKDTIRLTFGHDCFSYPDSIYSNICKYDSVDHYVFLATLDMGSFINGPAEVVMCENFDVSTMYQIIGIGEIENMLIQISNDSSSLIGASMSINDETNTDIMSVYRDTTGTFDLKQKIISAKPDGLKAGDKVNVVLKFSTDCEYKGSPIYSRAVIVTSACDTLYGDTLEYRPPVMKGYPSPDKKTILSDVGELKNLGGKVELAIQAYNEDTTATKNKTRVTLVLPNGFTYTHMTAGSSPAQITDTTIVWELSAGIAPSSAVVLKPILSHSAINCDTVSFKYLLSDLSIGCSAQPCIQRDTTFLFKKAVKCYPCPPEIKLSERCKEVPVFNVVDWEYPVANYCPDDQNFIYKLYYSATGNGHYVLLDSTHNHTYTHDSLEVYDGCYYVTVSDVQQNLTSTSNVACKSTCREQFQCGDLFIPNLVTPNKDGNNDVFQITGAYTTLKIEIYNAWGSTVYKSNDYKNEWDAKGLADGVYYYHLFIDGSDQKCLGWVHVLGGKD